MPRMPTGWKKKRIDGKEVYTKGEYEIQLYKKYREKKYVLEVFRQFNGFKRRLSRQEFFSLDNARKVIWQLMRQKEIRGYYSSFHF